MKGIVTIGRATTPDEAAALQAAGVDAIVASGFEAGGHRGSFLRAAEDSLTGTFSLVPQIADMVNVPVIAAGGIADARGVIAALTLGAEGVQIGTVFLACEESGTSLLHRQALRQKKAGHTALTRGFTGRLAGNPQPLDGGVEPGGNGNSAVSAATRTCQKPRDGGGGGGPIRSSAPMGWAKCQCFDLH